jgi:hypothetical protein
MLGYGLFLLFFACFGYFIGKVLLRGIVDEVWDCDDSLIIKDKGHEVQIPLSHFSKVTFLAGRPPRITLSLKEPCELGSQISFIPQSCFFPFSMPPIGKQLEERIDAAEDNSRSS